MKKILIVVGVLVLALVGVIVFVFGISSNGSG